MNLVDKPAGSFLFGQKEAATSFGFILPLLLRKVFLGNISADIIYNYKLKEKHNYLALNFLESNLQ